MLRRAGADARKLGVDLSDWEGEFLGSVEERITTFGRAFADPEKGAPGAPLSAQQNRKLREIRTKISAHSERASHEGGTEAGSGEPARGRRTLRPGGRSPRS